MDRNRVTLALLLSFISHLCRVDAAFQYLNVTCAPDFGNYTEVSVYARNLDILLPELSSKGTTRAFHTSTAGAVPNKVYGLYQCRGDVSQDVCADCIQDAAEKIVQGCPLFAEAAVWYEECMLRYANHSIFSVPETYPGYYLWSLRNFSDYGKSAPVLARTLHSVINDAAKISSKGHFATKSDNWTIFDNVYSLAQCTPDLTEFDCRNCLMEARSDMINEFNTSTRVAVFLASCQLRYDTTLKFYRDTTSEPPAPSPSNTSETDFLAGKTTKKSHEESKLTTSIIAGIAVGAFVGVILLAAGVWFCVRQFRQSKIKVPSTTTTTVITSQPPGPPPPPKVKENAPQDKNYGSTHDLGEVEFVQHDFATLKAATNGFSNDNKLGEGGFGVVYLGTLNNGQQVAIKRLSGNSGQGANEFMTEAQLVAKLQHRNLVKLLGFCSEGNEKLLVYEFLPNISLDSFLFDPKKRTNLDWEKRYKIIMGVARGIQYLHEDSRITIIHRDLKPSNILLDTDMNPKIADFGMARLFEREQQLANTKRVVGTRGYMAHEYVLAGEYSEKSDVYSFGIIILELISGQKNRMQYQSSQKEDLPILAWNLWDTGRSLEFMDPTLYNNCSKSEVMRCIQIGLLCVQHNAMYRPTMSTVVLMLTGSIALTPPTTPAMFPNQFNLPTSYDEDRRQSEEAASTKSVVWRSDIEQDLYPR